MKNGEMGDFISRDAALACIDGWQDRDGDIVSPDELPEYQKIEMLPTADVRENRHGHWIKRKSEVGIAYIQCSNCNVWFWGDMLVRRSFCPNCGADMREEDES